MKKKSKKAELRQVTAMIRKSEYLKIEEMSLAKGTSFAFELRTIIQNWCATNLTQT